jgi:hypothetical protein
MVNAKCGNITGIHFKRFGHPFVMSLEMPGEKEADRAMANFVSDLPNHSIIVEGYSGRSSPDERFLRSQEQALAVQRYVAARSRT